MFITYKTFDDLLPYDPFGNISGPWRIHGDQHQHLQEVDLSGKTKRIDLEFMFGQLKELYNTTDKLINNLI